jgi:hypothetical protein
MNCFYCHASGNWKKKIAQKDCVVKNNILKFKGKKCPEFTDIVTRERREMTVNLTKTTTCKKPNKGRKERSFRGQYSLQSFPVW